MKGYVYIGDPWNPATTKLGPFTVESQPNSKVALFNREDKPIAAAAASSHPAYSVQPGAALNQQPGSPRAFGFFGQRTDGQVFAWELFTPSGNTLTAWNGEIYPFAVGE